MGKQSLVTHVRVSVFMAGRWSGSPVHREHSQGAKEVLPSSRGTWESPVLLGTHFRSQGEIDCVSWTIPHGPPKQSFRGLSCWEMVKRVIGKKFEKTHLFLLYKFQVYSIVIQHLYILQGDHPQKTSYYPSPFGWTSSLLLSTPQSPSPTKHQSILCIYEFVLSIFFKIGHIYF